MDFSIICTLLFRPRPSPIFLFHRFHPLLFLPFYSLPLALFPYLFPIFLRLVGCELCAPNQIGKDVRTVHMLLTPWLHKKKCRRVNDPQVLRHTSKAYELGSGMVTLATRLERTDGTWYMKWLLYICHEINRYDRLIVVKSSREVTYGPPLGGLYPAIAGC